MWRVCVNVQVELKNRREIRFTLILSIELHSIEVLHVFHLCLKLNAGPQRPNYTERRHLGTGGGVLGHNFGTDSVHCLLTY